MYVHVYSLDAGVVVTIKLTVNRTLNNSLPR
jgi:hypothetical protein